MSTQSPSRGRPEIDALFSSVVRRDLFLGPQLVVAAAILLDLSLPDKLTLGPAWLLPSAEGLLLIGLFLTMPNRKTRRHLRLRRDIGIALAALVSAVNVVSLALLIHYLLRGGKSSGHSLILAGVVLWITNVLLFGIWYWEIDRGGPIERLLNQEAPPDFLFVQMSDAAKFSRSDWRPGLIDYLYTSFTNATAFSPTDTMPLTATAKVLMTIQSTAALATIGLVVARAVNILS